MAFHDDIIFPDVVGYWATGGPQHSTSAVETKSGYEYRNRLWQYPKCAYDISQGLNNRAGKDLMIATMRAVGGSAEGFLFKDWADFTTATGGGAGLLNSVLGGTSGVGDGSPTYQLHKQYTSASSTALRPILKPKSGTVTPYSGGVPVAFGSGAGQCSLDYTTGLLTFVANASQAPSAIGVGSSTTFTFTGTDNLNLAIGQVIYPTGITGTSAPLLNGQPLTITNKTGTGPWIYTVGINTTGLTVTATGTTYRYPQPSDALTWVGEFYVPVRFGADLVPGGWDTGLYTWPSIPLIELRNPT